MRMQSDRNVWTDEQTDRGKYMNGQSVTPDTGTHGRTDRNM